MPSYNYTAIGKTGRRVRDSIDAASLEAAKNSLRGAGYTILDIQEQNVLNRDINIPFLGNPGPKDMAVFCRQFVSILRAGVPVSTVLGMLSQQTENKKLRTAIREMQADVEKGYSLAVSMRRQNRIFPNMLVNMVAAGEESGNLEDSFRQMEIYFEKSTRVKSSVGKVLIYPCILLIVMIIVLIVMMTKIIPMFLQTFEEMDVELPAITRGVMAVSHWFGHWWWALLLGLAALIAAGTMFHRTNKGRHFFGLLGRKMPVVGKLIVNAASATFCRTVSLLLASGLSLTDALELTAANLNNVYFEESTRTMRTLISEGWSLGVALKELGLFPAMVCNMASIGEETGELQEILAKTADYYDEEVESSTQKLLALLEPIVILFMAVFVVIIVFSIFLPMLNMTKAYDQYL